jgi:hypothetical protein
MSASRLTVIAVPYKMNNYWNGTDAAAEIAEIHASVTAALTAALVEWVWQGHDWVVTPPPHRLTTVWIDKFSGELSAGRGRVQAITEFLDDSRSPLAEIRLAIKGPLDWDSLLVVGWIIAHEFVCYAQQVPPRDARPRAACRENGPFFEGWMDEVAHALFNIRVVSEASDTPVTGFLRQYAQQILAAVADFRHDRYEAGPGGDPHPLARQWQLGAQAARILWRFFETCTAYEQEETRRRAALAQLVSLSYRIQGATSSPEMLRRIVNGCLLAGQAALSFMRGDQRARLLHLLTQPILESTVWIYEIESLCRTFPV